MRKSSLVVLVLMAAFIIVQVLIGGKYGQLYIPLLWLIICIVPVIYLISTHKPAVKSAFILGYSFLVLLTPFLQGASLKFQNIPSGTFLLISFGWLIPAQVLLWLSGRKASAIKAIQERPEALDRSLLDKVRNELVPENRTDAAIALLQSMHGLHADEKEQLALISARNVALCNNVISNLIDTNTAGREQAHINSSLLAFTGQLMGTIV